METGRPRGLVLDFDDIEAMTAVFKALGSKKRLRILRLASGRLLNVTEIAEELSLPISTANAHVGVLEEAGLLLTEHRPAARGSQKVCTCAFESVFLQIPVEGAQNLLSVEYTLPIGAYVDCEVAPTCGLASETGIIGLFDDPDSFYETDRLDAQLLWFRHGFVEYRFPRRLPPTAELESLDLSFEVCSEAPLYHHDWPSDITLWINGIEAGTWTSPADFGGRRGKLTPEWWSEESTQYGQLKIWRVDHEGTKVDGLAVSDVSLSDVALSNQGFVSVRIGVKPDARHVGGLNLFGRLFGNYPQDIVMRLRYRSKL